VIGLRKSKTATFDRVESTKSGLEENARLKIEVEAILEMLCKPEVPYKHILEPCENEHAMIRVSTTQYRQPYLLSPSRERLLTLTRYNIMRAFIANITSIGLDIKTIGTRIPSPFTLESATNDSWLSRIPIALRPTDLQRTRPHHPYMDLFPLASMREALIEADGTMDHHEFNADIMGTGITFEGRPGIIVWGEPWDPFSMELTEEFAQKWSQLFSRCPELLESTNYWRAKRDQPRLVLLEEETKASA
jgi:hypothetical protein